MRARTISVSSSYLYVELADTALEHEVRGLLTRLDFLAARWSRDMATCGFGVSFLQSGPSTAPQEVRHASNHVDAGADDQTQDVNSDDDSELFESDQDEDDPVAELVEANTHLLEGEDEDEVEVELEETAQRADLFPAAPAAPRMAATTPDSVSTAGDVPQADTTKVRSGPARAAPSDAVVNLADTSEEDETRSDEEGPAQRTAQELGRRCGNYVCNEDDIARFASRTRWLSGDGLAVFAESHVQEVKNPRIGHLDSTAFRDLKVYVDARERGDTENADKNKAWVTRKIEKVRTSVFSIHTSSALLMRA